ncbi:sulfur oxidation c-type cytochrome SoxX [Oceaniovalibus sp. ACAM 378]|uniref:sulfur oxidation c-type cytochrome SoxX n=1 Tax=Oceaniovalibus sp. ACAM 378 TaxID=2599923 RepID=UPI0011D9C4BA|nr:sulfur oxidation c-type cytochrome SoxX [Oceaniovalibus sp. ACAM 378]TYB87186.1 sulfur oxidation c-type cytochrome SoxX [Oceaniovalibus sp. ACAM 378]
MERKFLMILTLAASTGAAFATEIPPSDVIFTDGAVEASLTGVAGDPENGRLIVGDKGVGNCVACHEISDLADVPFQGTVGPMLDGTGARWSEAELRGIVSNAKMMFDESMMPSFYRVDGFTRPGNEYTGEAADDSFAPLLDAQKVEDVVAYLTTLKE